MNKAHLVVATRALGVAGSIAVALGLFGCGGTGAEGGCPEGVSCGDGSPAGYWVVKTKCEYSPSAPAQPLNYNEYSLRPPNPLLPPVQPMATTNGDWCSNLDYSPGGILEVVLWHPAIPLGSGTMSLAGDSTYETDLQFRVDDVTSHFTVACLQSGGVAASCSKFASDLQAFYAGPMATPMAMSQGVTNIRCRETADQGCDCSYSVSVALVDKGTWSSSGGVLYQNSESYTLNGNQVVEDEPAVPTPATYCKNGTLTLTGVAGASLAGVQGLRTLTMTPGQAPPPAPDAGP